MVKGKGSCSGDEYKHQQNFRDGINFYSTSPKQKSIDRCLELSLQNNLRNLYRLYWYEIEVNHRIKRKTY